MKVGRTPVVSKHVFNIRRVTAIDGLRGLAVLAVVIYHLFGNVMRGYLGVDVFFVLSGFLITSLLVRERAVTGAINVKDFWLRRFRRIVPAAWFVLVVCTIAAGFIGGDSAVHLPFQFLGAFLFVSNWTQIADAASYFVDAGARVFANYWSLAVEEQFYLVWPLLFLLLGKIGVKPRTIRWFVLGGAALSLAWMMILYSPNVDPTREYYGTDTHAFGLLIGAALALWITDDSIVPAADSWPRTRRFTIMNEAALRLTGLASLAGLVVLLFTLPDTSPLTYRGGLALASLLAAVVLYALVRGISPLVTIFDVRVLRWLGRISFSLYLWHWPIIVLVRELTLDTSLARTPWVGVIALVISLPVSHWTYTYIETPFRRYGYQHCFRSVFGRAVPGWRKLVVSITTLGVTATAGVAMALAPDQTKLERDLAEVNAQVDAVKQQAQQAEEARQAEIAQRTMPTGDQITAIGDSVMLASSAALQKDFPNIYIDAAVSRHYQAALPIIEEMKAAGTLDPNVVLGFGTNGASSGARPGLLTEILDAIGPDRVVVLVLPYGDRYWMPEAEAEVLEAARTRDNVYVADWCHAAKAHPEDLREDLIHPTPDGAVLYASAVQAAFEQWKQGKHEVPGECGI